MAVTQAVRVLTVDDQAMFRDVAGEVIAATDGFEDVGEAASGEEALELGERRSGGRAGDDAQVLHGRTAAPRAAG
jgi:CheY-like chemotaxis protein